MFKVIYAEEVYDDIQNAVDFYNSQSIQNQPNEYTHHRHPRSCRNQFSLRSKTTPYYLRIGYRFTPKGWQIK